ncbi:SURF1 family protein [Salinisphaera sp. LB1]|uniref:SURF1 family protein n=1 Tax=Salinisphaera sp. LB1 TaxID=2183911 RepID=UPI000D70856E|nr:SURF1 family protein [Salinisphaera sp. LB1]AWN14621.1 Cytochrome oxidase biogenesis protein Surf1, facilitates heme A insertion [Salinisphaera sp. LB1]
MNIGSFRFAPPWWGVAITVVGMAILSALGVWQIERAHYKERLVAEHAAARRAGPQHLRLDAAAVDSGRGPRHGYRYIVSGHYDAAHQLLLSDQVQGTRSGYRVWTPLVLDSGVRVMVDRGWVPKTGDRSAPKPNPQAPAGRVTVRGYWQGFPQPGLRLGHDRQCSLTGWPRALNYPPAATVRCQYGAPVANGLLLLNPKAPGGFLRDWDEDAIGLRPWAHYVYASQWFLMAVIALIILVVVNTRRRA